MPWEIRWHHEYTTRVANYATTHQRFTDDDIRDELGLDEGTEITREHVEQFANLDEMVEAQREDADYDQETLDHDPTETRVEEINEIVPPPPPLPPPPAQVLPTEEGMAPGTWATTVYTTGNTLGTGGTGLLGQTQYREEVVAIPPQDMEPALPRDQRLWGGRNDTVISHTHPAHCECHPCVVNREYKVERPKTSKRTKGIVTIGVLTGKHPRPIIGAQTTLPDREPCAECDNVQCTCDD